MKKYTQKQIKELKSNPYTLQVSDKRIFFTIEFKKIFWKKYQAGMSPKSIFKEMDYNLDYFGQKQIDSIVQRVKKEALAGEFTEGYSGSESGRTVNGNRRRDVWQRTVCSDRSGNLLCGINSDKETDGSI